MATAALSPNSVLASPIQVNPQVKNDLQTSVPQVSQDAQKAVRAVQTDTVIISPQALKMSADSNPPPEVKQQVKVDSQKSAFHDAKEVKDARIAARTSQFDTISISPQALQLAADKDAIAKDITDREEEQSASQSLNSKAAAEKNETRPDLPIADDKSAADKAAARKADEKQALQLANEKAEAEKKSAGKSALKAADDRAEAVKVAADKAEERRAAQLANDKHNAEKKAARKRAVKAYAAVGSNK